MSGFIIKVLRMLAVLVVAYAVLAIMFFVGLAGLVAVFSPKPVVVQPDTVLVLDLGFVMNDRPLGEDPVQLVIDAFNETSTRQLHLMRVLQTLERAQSDSNITALLIQGNVLADGYSASFAALRELRAAIGQFADSKPVYAYVDGDSLRDLYIKSVATHVYAHPHTAVDFRGLSSQGVYLGEALERLGIRSQNLALEEFKTAGEMLENTRMSDADRLQRQALIDSIWATIRDAIGDSRGLEQGALDRLAAENLLLYAQDVIDSGLVDEGISYNGLVDLLSQIGRWDDKIDSFRQFDFIQYARQVEDPLQQAMAAFNSDSEIAVVYVEGLILFGYGGENSIGEADIRDLMRELREDASVAAVVLRINSPGGSALASVRIADEIRLTNAVKPVIVSMGGVAASAGYQAAAYSDYVFAEEATITGSIGVFSQFMHFQELSNRWSVYFDGVETHPFASSFLPIRPMNDEELRQREALTRRFYADFLNDVAIGRGKDSGEVEAVAGGRVWTGTAALEVGLVDAIGGLQDAVRMAANRTGLGSAYRIGEYPQVRSFEERLGELFSSRIGRFRKQTRLSKVQHFLQRLDDEFSLLLQMNDPQDLYFLLPFSHRMD